MGGDYRLRLAVKLAGTPLPSPDSPEAKSYRNMVVKAAKVLRGMVESQERDWALKRAIVNIVTDRAYVPDDELIDKVRALHADAMRWQGFKASLPAPNPTTPTR